MKNIIQWLDELPIKVAEQAKRNCRIIPYKNGGTKVGSLKSALLHAFIWSCTDEGTDYWASIFMGNYSNQLELI